MKINLVQNFSDQFAMNFWIRLPMVSYSSAHSRIPGIGLSFRTKQGFRTRN